LAPRLPTLDDVDVKGKRVLVRGDLNVPLSQGTITDDFRIRAFLPTLGRILEAGGRVIVCSHLGRPKGPDPAFTLAPVATALSEALAGDVPLVDDYAHVPNVRAALLENLRFDPGETANAPDFVEQLVSLADVYVNDAFGSCHRAHASIVGPPSRLPSAAGPLLLSEVQHLDRLLSSPERPFVVVLGGAKVADKIGVVRNFVDRADRVLIGGGMCFTFLKARGAEIGRSLVDEAHLDEVRELTSDRIVLPTDVVHATAIGAGTGEVSDAQGIGIRAEHMGVGIGPQTAASTPSPAAGIRLPCWRSSACTARLTSRARAGEPPSSSSRAASSRGSPHWRADGRAQADHRR
jgi:phosphoglycerate kinase